MLYNQLTSRLIRAFADDCYPIINLLIGPIVIYTLRSGIEGKDLYSSNTIFMNESMII